MYQRPKPRTREKTERELGSFEICLNVNDLGKSLQFYEALGFNRVAGNIERGWTVLEYQGVRLGLFQGILGGSLLNFRGGDVLSIAEYLQDVGISLGEGAVVGSDGTVRVRIRDPDGNQITFVGQ
jgi:catechol 2,3-dioxygenase-like lactoylglutathione lyase family enzyme